MRALKVLYMGLVGVAFMGLLGCQTAYYSAMEKFGVHKRDIMVDRVEEARDAQVEAKEQFQVSLERFSALTGFQGGKLEEVYTELKAELDRSEEKAQKVRDRIEGVEDVSEALFAEWEDELDQYTSASLRRASERQLDQTRQSYLKLIAAMKRAESRIDPVLRPLRDQVLFLKHNLNAQAIASLQSELVAVEADVDALIREMERSIAEADAFISTMGRG